MAGSFMTQMHPPAPSFTEETCPDLSSKVFIVTGGYAGVGLELVKILYQKNGKIYIAGRSAKKGSEAIQNITAAFPKSSGQLNFLPLDLADLITIKASAEEFMAKENRLDVLWNNAGVMTPPKGSKTAQGYELQLGTNCLGPFLFTQLLLPILRQTAASSPPNSVRVLFTASLMAELSAPKGGINFDDINHEKSGSQNIAYGQSKIGNIFLGHQFAQRSKTAGDGILFASLNPGNLKSELQRNTGRLAALFTNILLHTPIYGAYTELFAGLSPAVTLEQANGAYILPWGRIAVPKKEIGDALRGKGEGGGGRGTGVAERFYDWCEAETRRFAL